VPVTITIEAASGGVGEGSLVTPDFRRVVHVELDTRLVKDPCGDAGLNVDLRVEQAPTEYTSIEEFYQ
jgi:hypothetical protein